MATLEAGRLQDPPHHYDLSGRFELLDLALDEAEASSTSSLPNRQALSE